MPIYEYGCRKCGREFEELVRSGSTPKCPDCGSEDVEKLMSQCCRSGGCSCSGGSSSSGGGCAGCSGGHCSSCGH
ncbi:MAG: zinc ribbon domain-containing protein [Desulfovibrio sp.]|nr:zinc ribbon domain-containing protein [Desulfovibrio sp.]